MKILIVGAGIAGLSLANALKQVGHTPLVIEKARSLSDGGYMIDFYGLGYKAAQRLGLLGELAQIHYPVAKLRFIDRHGKLRFAIRYPLLRKKIFDNQHFNFLRGELEGVLYNKIADAVVVRFGTTLTAIEDHDTQVTVQFSDGSRDSFDLLVGADGIHSAVREMTFAAEVQFSRYLGYVAAAYFVSDGQQPADHAQDFTTMTVPRRQVAVYPVRGGRFATFFAYRQATPPPHHQTTAEAWRKLKQVYSGLDWLVPQLLAEDHPPAELYFDAASQIIMPTWSKGHVTLLGDACGCVSLLAGQGASLAMAGAVYLANELAYSGGEDMPAALARYEAKMRPLVVARQAAGRGMADWFVPNSSWRMFLRDLFTRMATWPLANRLIRRSLSGGGKL